MPTSYQKSKDELTDEDRTFLQTTLDAFVNGVRIYGVMPDDTSHIGWLMGVVLTELKKESGASVLELGHDIHGFFISLVIPD